MLYCPKCGKGLAEEGNTLKCVPGDMPFSIRLDKVIRERFGPGAKATSISAPGYQPGARWYCPGCGIPIVSEEGIICSQCGKSLDDLLHTLVELHPHL
jgi:hypothetical protein